MKPATYVLDAARTGGTRFLDQNNDTVAWVRGDIFPPVETDIHLPDGSLALVTGLTLDSVMLPGLHRYGFQSAWSRKIIEHECPSSRVS
jgi:hypothetical protein